MKCWTIHAPWNTFLHRRTFPTGSISGAVMSITTGPGGTGCFRIFWISCDCRLIARLKPWIVHTVAQTLRGVVTSDAVHGMAVIVHPSRKNRHLLFCPGIFLLVVFVFFLKNILKTFCQFTRPLEVFFWNKDLNRSEWIGIS